MRNRLITLFHILGIGLLLTGCWDRREINDISIVTSTALDMSGEQYRVSVQFPMPGRMGGPGNAGGGGGQRGDTWYLDSKSGETIRDSNAKQQASLSRQLYFAHRRVVLIGEELARSGIRPIMDLLTRLPQNRMTALMLITKGEGREVLSAEAPVENTPSEMLRELATEAMKDPVTIKSMIQTLLRDGKDPVIPYAIVDSTNPGSLGKTHDSIRIDGLAIFREDKLRGFTSAIQAKGLLIAMNQAKRMPLTYVPPGVDGAVTILLEEVKATPKLVGYRDGKIHLKLEIRGNGILMENQSSTIFSTARDLRKLEKLLSQLVQEHVLTSLNDIRENYQCDAVGFGAMIHRKDPRLWRMIREEWPELYKAAELEVSVSIQMMNGGTTLKPAGFREEQLHHFIHTEE